MKDSKTPAHKSHTLKQIKSRLAQIRAEQEAYKADQVRVSKKITEAAFAIKALEEDLRRLTSDEIVVSEHAMLRYVERVFHINLAELKERIVPKETVSVVKALGNGKYPVGDTHSILIKDGVVVTIEIEATQEVTT